MSNPLHLKDEDEAVPVEKSILFRYDLEKELTPFQGGYSCFIFIYPEFVKNESF